MKVVIAEPGSILTLAVQEFLGSAYTVVSCRNRDTLITDICEEAPDILFLDMTFPGNDGITVLRALQASAVYPRTIVASRYFSYFMEDALADLGVCYLMCKPYEAAVVANRIMDIATGAPIPDIRPNPVHSTENILLTLGFDRNRMGVECLLHCIPAAVRNEGKLYMKVLYLDAAKEYGRTTTQVEREIRFAIETAWKNRDNKIWALFFPCDSDGEIPPMSNSEFIHCIAQLILKQMRGRA